MTEQNFEPMRRAMVASQLRTTGVNDPRVIAAMGEVARERFVPAERAALAYADATVPLANGRALNPPMALGRLLTEAQLQGDERALVIGAATGYAAAVLARLVGSGHRTGGGCGAGGVGARGAGRNQGRAGRGAARSRLGQGRALTISS